MAPLPLSIFSEGQNALPQAAGGRYPFPSGMPGVGASMPRPVRPPVGGGGAAPVDDVFVVVVSLAVVAGLTVFVLLQAIAALKEALETSTSPFCTVPLAQLQKHGLLLSINSTKGERTHLLPLQAPSQPSMISLDSQGCRRDSRWVGTHRCQFTLSPERYESDSESTLTRSSSSSTVVGSGGGRICVVWDDTIPSGNDCAIDDDDEESEEEEDGESDSSEDEETTPTTTTTNANKQTHQMPSPSLLEKGKQENKRPLYIVDRHEARTRVRRQAIFST